MQQREGNRPVGAEPLVMLDFMGANQLVRNRMIIKLEGDLPKESSDGFFNALSSSSSIYGSITIGPFSDELWKLGKAMRNGEEYFRFLIVIHHYFKVVEYATIRTVKEKF
jgi:hypothetical protein